MDGNSEAQLTTSASRAATLSFGGIRGGHCGPVAAAAEKILGDRDTLWEYLTEQYGCRPEAVACLASLPVGSDDLKSMRMVSRNAGQTRVTTGKAGHEARVRLNCCSGWLVIELSTGCSPPQSFTRGACAIEGVSRY